MIDYHVHLWAHGSASRAPSIEDLAAYCEVAAGAGVSELAITEHLFRFAQAGALAGFWHDDPAPVLRSRMAAYWAENAVADLDQYVEVVSEAKAAGLPVVLGLEVDHHPGRMGDVGRILDGYPFDVLLGSVHWLGGWGFDNLDDPVFLAEWDNRTVESTWERYTESLEELAQSGTCDVLAHPDLPKVGGRRPDVPDEWYDRMAAAAAAAGMAAEVSSAGWRKPIGEPYPAPALLDRLGKAGVAVTTASDAHRLDDVGRDVDQLVPLLADAGYESVTTFRARLARPVAL